jgi:membrane protein implicated in regulation of membrane protease activity
MIEMFVAVTILLVLIAATFMALLKAPWWVALFFGSLLVVAINRLMHPSQDQDEEGN